MDSNQEKCRQLAQEHIVESLHRVLCKIHVPAGTMSKSSTGFAIKPAPSGWHSTRKEQQITEWEHVAFVNALLRGSLVGAKLCGILCLRSSVNPVISQTIIH